MASSSTLHPFLHENLDYLTYEILDLCFLLGSTGIDALIKTIWFHEDHPENHNIRVPSSEKQEAYKAEHPAGPVEHLAPREEGDEPIEDIVVEVYGTQGWKLHWFSNIVERMITMVTRLMIMKQMMDDKRKSTGPFRHQLIQKVFVQPKPKDSTEKA